MLGKYNIYLLKTSLNNWRRLISTLGRPLMKSISNPEDTLISRDSISCTLIPGDGVGPELVESVKNIFEAANVPIVFETYPLSELKHSQSCPLAKVADSIAFNRICLKGILDTPHFSHKGEVETLNMRLRKRLDLYANVVHAKSLCGVPTRHNNVDCIIIREQTEGEYSALEHECLPGIVECLKIITRKKSLKIARFAFDYALKLGRKKVTAVHKANIMKKGDGLFLESCKEISELYPRIAYDTMIVDNTSMQLVSKPEQFDVLVTPNQYGHILCNLAAGLVGGAGVIAGASYSSDCAVFEQGARHAYVTGKGRNVANPTAMVLTAVNLLRHCNLETYADIIMQAVYTVIAEGKVMTKDMGGCACTTDFTNAIIENLNIVGQCTCDPCACK